jgi:hypothetical protein
MGVSPAPVSAAARAVAVTACLVAISLLALAPMLYFAAGASDSASEGVRITYALIPLAAAWLPLCVGLGVIHRKRTGQWGLPFGRPGRRAAVLVLLAAVMLAVARALGDHSTIYGDGEWAAFWLTCLAAWAALGWASTRREGR